MLKHDTPFASLRAHLHRLGQQALQFALPNQCGLCGAADRHARLLCDTCARQHISAQLQTRCSRCGINLPTTHPSVPGTICGTCLTYPPAFDCTLVAFDYTAPWDAAIGALKFGHRLPYAKLLAHAWQQQVIHVPLLQIMPIDILLPAPLATQRLRERGFNQALEITRHLARQNTLPIDTTPLVKVRDTLPQVGLSHKERLRNVRGAFSCLTSMQGKHVGVVDDVMTSGATLAEIATTLKHAGAASVTNLVIARTPKSE